MALSMFVGLSLFSCGFPNYRRDYIVPGEFYGVNDYEKEFSTYLKIEEISEEEYSKSNGINAIKDLVGGGYYSLIFTYTDSSGNVARYDFKNLADAYNGVTSTPISYLNDNDTWFTPFTSVGEHTSLAFENCYYSVHIPDESINIFSYLYPEGSPYTEQS